MSQIPIFRYKCPLCANQYPVIINDGKCFCGGILYDTLMDIKKDEYDWYFDAFNTFPCVLAHEYHRLYELSQSNNAYGVFLQLKDVIESTIKFVVLSACVYGKTHNIDGRIDAYEKEIAGERLSLGNWVDIAILIKKFYKRTSIKNDDTASNKRLPNSLWKLIDKLPAWVGNNQLVSWRNEKLGHGALRFDDDPEFRKELIDKVRAITQFYRDNQDAFKAIQILSDGSKLQGYENTRNLRIASAPCSLLIDGEEMCADPLIQHTEYGIFFYDEIIKKRTSRMLNYPSGHAKLQYNEYTAHLAHLLYDQGTILSASLDSDFVTKSENDFLSRLSFESEYIEPTYLTKWLREAVTKHSKGVFLLEMERGCGKTFFSEKLNSRFAKPQIIFDDIDVRTYHLSRTQNGGITEFTAGIASEWNQCYENRHEMARSISLDTNEDSSMNALALADFLNKWQEYTASSDARYRRQRIMLVLDGLDEIKESDEAIWSYIPNVDLLNEGVYILLTGRNILTDQIPEKYIQRVNSLHCQELKRVTADSDENLILLNAYISAAKLPNLDEQMAISIMKIAEYKILGLSLLCHQIKKQGITDTSAIGMQHIILDYLQMLESQYNAIGSVLFRRTLAILASICELEPLSLREIADLLLMGSIKIELLGLLADISPLLTVERIVSDNGDLYWDTNRHHFANHDITTTVKEYLKDDLGIIITDIIQYIRQEIKEDYSNGSIAFISHISEIQSMHDLFIDWSASDLSHINTQAQKYYENVVSDNSIADLRLLNIADQVINIGHQLDTNNRDDATAIIIDSYLTKLSICRNMGERFLIGHELFELINKAHYSNLDSKMYALCRLYTENSLLDGSNDSAQKALEYIDRIEVKDDAALEAELFACDAYLRTEIRLNHDDEYLMSRDDIAKRSIVLCNKLFQSGSQYSRMKIFDVFMRMAFYFENNISTQGGSVARQSYSLYENHFSELQRKGKISLKERTQQVDLFSRMAISYILTSEFEKAKEYTKTAFATLVNIRTTSALVTHSNLLNCYFMALGPATRLQTFGEIDNDIFEDALYYLVDFMSSIPATQTDTLITSTERALETCANIVIDPKGKTGETVYKLLELMIPIETLDKSGEVSKRIAMIYAQLALSGFQYVETNSSNDCVQYLSYAEMAIAKFESMGIQNDSSEDWLSRYFTCKCWLACAIYLSAIYEDNPADDGKKKEILNSYLIAAYWLRFGFWPQDFHDTEMEYLFSTLMSSLQAVLMISVGCVMKKSSKKRNKGKSWLLPRIRAFTKSAYSTKSKATVNEGWELLSDTFAILGERDDSVRKILEGIVKLSQSSREQDDYIVASFFLFFYHASIKKEDVHLSGALDRWTETLFNEALYRGKNYYEDLNKNQKEKERLAKEQALKAEQMKKEKEDADNRFADFTIERIQKLVSDDSYPLDERAKEMLSLAITQEATNNESRIVELYEEALNLSQSLADREESESNLVQLAKVLDHYGHHLSTHNDVKCVSIQKEMIQAVEKLYKINPTLYQEKLGGLYALSANNLDRIGEHDDAYMLYKKALSIFESIKGHEADNKRIRSWFQMHMKLSIFGHIQCRLNQFGNFDNQDVISLNNRGLWENRICYGFSKNALAPIIDSPNEKDYFYRLLDFINARDVWFFMTPGGDTFNEEITHCSMSEYLYIAHEWTNTLDELGFPDYLYEKLVDKDSLWVCEFFSKLLHYGKLKYN